MGKTLVVEIGNNEGFILHTFEHDMVMVKVKNLQTKVIALYQIVNFRKKTYLRQLPKLKHSIL